MKNIETSNWKASIDKPSGKTPENKILHVTGNVDTHSSDFASLSKKVPQGFNPMILLLDLNVENGIAPAANPQKMKFSESIGKHQYTFIDIFLRVK